MERYKKLLVGTTLTLALSVTAGSLALYGAPSSDLQKQWELIDKEIQQKENLLQQKKKEESKALVELRSINNTLSSAEKKLRNTTYKLTTTEKELAFLEVELAKTEKELNENTTALKTRLTAMYEQGEVHILEVLLNSTSISDFLTRWDLFSRIAQNDVQLIDLVAQEKKKFEEKTNLALVKKETLLSLRQDQDQQKHELLIASSRQKELYSDIKSERSNIESALDDLENESRKIADEIRRMTGGTKYLGSGNLNWPTPGYSRITSPFGWRRHPILKTRRFHSGVDIGAPYGARIEAAEHGKVIFSGWRGAYGRVVMIDHGGGIVTMYAHTSASLVNVGQSVVKGEAIAKVGSTGWSTGPHLHFEVRKDGEPDSPLSYLK